MDWDKFHNEGVAIAKAAAAASPSREARLQIIHQQLMDKYMNNNNSRQFHLWHGVGSTVYKIPGFADDYLKFLLKEKANYFLELVECPWFTG
jgi:hypothetical protein